MIMAPLLWFKHMLFVNGFGKVKMQHQPLFYLLLLYTFPLSESVSFYKQYRTRFPAEEELPATDVTLNLQENRLTYIPDGAMCNMSALETLNLVNNRLVTVGNLSCVGHSLRILNLHGNRITSILEDALQGFVKLQDLHLGRNQLTAITGLHHVANTLQVLVIHENPLDGNFPSEDTPPLNSLTKLTMIKIGLKGLPSGLHLPNLTELYFGSEELNIRSAEVLQCALPSLEVLQIQKAQLRFFPDLRHAGQKLRVLNLEHNPIRSVSKDLLVKAPRLQELILDDTEVSTVPCLFGSSLRVLRMARTPATEIPCVPPSLRHLDLTGAAVRRVEARRAVLMTRLEKVLLGRIPNLMELHDFMDLPRGKYLTVRPSQNLDPCKCEHAWMKRARGKKASAYVNTNAACGDGENWYDITYDRLLDICNTSTFQAQNTSTGSVWSILRHNAPSCDLPEHAYYASVPQVTCGRHCLALPGCTTYKFLGLKGRMGHCQVLVPTTPAAPVTVPDAENAEWKCYTALPGDI